MTYHFVGKVIAAADDADQMFLKVYAPDQPLDLMEPLEWTVAGRPFDDDGSYDLLILHSGGVRHVFDELRIGTSWESVTKP